MRAAMATLTSAISYYTLLRDPNCNSFSNRTPVNYLKIAVPMRIIARSFRHGGMQPAPETLVFCSQHNGPARSLSSALLFFRRAQPANRCRTQNAGGVLRGSGDYFRLVLHRFVLTIRYITLRGIYLRTSL